MDYKKMDAEAIRMKLEEGRLHLNFVTKLYEDQIRRGKFFLHEQPATAMSWKEESVEKLIDRYSNIHVVKADQCAYGLVTPSEADPSQLIPALKPTKFMTNSRVMADQLSRRCSDDHVQQPFVACHQHV